MGEERCRGCNTLMLDDSEHGAGRPDNPFCRICTREDGTPLTFEEAVNSHAFWLQSKGGVPPGQALEAAREILEGNPAWEGRD